MKIHFLLLALLGIVVCQLTNAKSSSESSSEFGSLEEESKCAENEFYSSKLDRCLTCSKCGPELYEKEECSEFRDTVCDGCFAENPLHNDDFFEKCSDFNKMYKNLKKIFKEIHAEVEKENVGERKTTSNYVVRNWQWINISMIVSITLALLLVGIWALCTMRRQYTRIINVTPPQLSEIDNHNIIYASKKIQEKMANKRGSIPYEHL